MSNVEFTERLEAALTVPMTPAQQEMVDARIAAAVALNRQRFAGLRSFGPSWLPRSRRFIVAAAALLLLVLPVGLAVADGRIPGVSLVFIQQPISGLITEKIPRTNVRTDRELQALLSFTLWIPTDVPCAGPNQRTYEPNQRTYDRSTQTATLVYQCLSLSERSTDRGVRPAVDQGTLEEVVIGGLPGYYYQSTYVQPWSGLPDTNSTLLFERDGTIITLSPLPSGERSSFGMVLSKAELIRIAESMKRVDAPQGR
jgi:hypothetical protein